MMYSTNILLSLISTIFKTINSSVDDTRKTLALFNKDWNTYKTNWQKGFASNGFAGGVKSVFQSTKSVVSPEQIQMLRTWNNAVKHGCTNQETFNKIIANADHNTKMYFAGLNKGKGTLDGLKKAQNATKASTIGLTIAQTALNMAISMGLMAAISLAIKGFDKMINHAKRASEAADEAFEETSSKVQEQQEELKTLDELISKYRELKKDGTLDIEGRKEVKELQNDIADLVGTQARNLDLVNGKLDDEIEKLDEISAKEAKKAYETATANYNNSQRANQNAAGDDSYIFFDGYAYTGSREKDAEKILKEYGFGNNVRSGGFFGSTLFITDSFDNDMNALEGAQEKADYLQSMIDVLEQNGQRATELYSGLISQRDKYLGYIDSQQGAANSLVNSWITYSQYSNEKLSNIAVNSVESFEAYRQKMIEAAKNDESVGKLLSDGTLSEKDLETAVNDFMATSTKFSDWYKQWIGDVQDTGGNANRMTDSLSELEKTSDNIKTLASAFKELSDDGYITTKTLGEIKTATGLSGDEWAEYENKLLNAKKGSADFNQVLSELTYKILENEFATIDLTNATGEEITAIENKIAATLRENGVTNANAVAHEYVRMARVNATIAAYEAGQASYDSAAALISESLSAEQAKVAMNQLELAKINVNNAKITSSDDIDNIIAIANAALASEQTLKDLAKAKAELTEGFVGPVSKSTMNMMNGTYEFDFDKLDPSDFKVGVPRYTGGSSKSGSDKNTPDYEDPTEAIINRINLRAKELEQDEEAIQNKIELAEAENDYKKQISLTNDLITKRKDRLVKLKTANDELHKMAEDLRNSTPDWNEEEWFDSQGNATKAYNTLYNNSSKKEQEKLEDQFERISKIKKAWVENAEEITELNKEILQGEKDVADLRWENSNDWIDERNRLNDWHLFDDNEVKAWERVIKWLEEEYPNATDKIKEAKENLYDARKGAIEESLEEIDAYIEKMESVDGDFSSSSEKAGLFAKKIDIVTKAFKDGSIGLAEYNDYINEFSQTIIDIRKTKTLDILNYQKNQISSLQSLQQSYYNVINAIESAQHEITKELEASLTMYEYLDEDTRKLIFNQEDYNVLSEKLVDIQSQANKLQKQYNRDILGATKETLEQITSQYEMQYETMMKQYEIAKAELEIAKKRQQLDNVLAEKNVKMFINGQWKWVANTQDVIKAQSELADAEYAAKVAGHTLQQTKSLNNLTAAQDVLTTTINSIDSGVIDFKNSLSSITEDLNSIITIDIPALRTIIGNIGSTINDYNRNVINSVHPNNGTSSTFGNATATLITGKTIDIQINSEEKTITPGLSKGTIVHTKGGDYKIIGGYAGNYVSEKYASGTNNAKSGTALVGEEPEILIDSNGRLIPINQPTLMNMSGGELVFNQSQLIGAKSLWDMVNTTIPRPDLLSNKYAPSESFVFSGDIIVNNPTDAEDVANNVVGKIVQGLKLRRSTM